MSAERMAPADAGRMIAVDAGTTAVLVVLLFGDPLTLRTKGGLSV